MLGQTEPTLLNIDIPATEAGTSPHRTVWYEWGNRDAPHTVICVHGLTRNGRDFDTLARYLSRDYRVLCPDITGRGQSQWLSNTSGYQNPAYIADVMFALGSMNIAKVHWVGTSMGGIMGLMAANLHPGLIDALVLNDIGCLIPASGLARIRDIADFQTDFASEAEAEAVFRMRCQHFGIRDESQWQHLLHYGLERRDGRVRFAYDPAIFTSGFSKETPLADISLWPLWPAVSSIPTLLIRGTESDILLHETSLEMQAHHPKLQLHEVAATGHAPTLMDTNETALILKWMNAVDKM